MAGSGFAGSLTAGALARRGLRVALVDKKTHPRFSIGESSTPLADFLLREIGQSYDLPELLPLSTWGSWRESNPQLRCGKKRGFSYFQHQRGKKFSESQDHERSYLVAATATDAQSDTHWMRSDVDAWLFDLARKSGVETIEAAEVTTLHRDGRRWRLGIEQSEPPIEITCNFFVDSTGMGNMLAGSVGLARSSKLRTDTAAVFGHFRDVASMTAELEGVYEDPFDADDAAQHHLLSDSLWCWMLRFCDGTTSVGLTGPTEQFAPVKDPESAQGFWSSQLQRYPTLKQLLGEAVLVDPCSGTGPRLGWIPKITKSWNAAAGANWAMLPTTAGIVDPMHSTGIAHALSGVSRLLDVLSSMRPEGVSEDALQAYSESVIDEILWVDLLVTLSHRAMRVSMDVFVAASSFYFVAAVHCERALAENGNASAAMPSGFLLARSTKLRHIAQQALERLEALLESPSKGKQLHFVDWVREQLSPWNDFGLLEPGCRNRIWRSTIDKD